MKSFKRWFNQLLVVFISTVFLATALMGQASALEVPNVTSSRVLSLFNGEYNTDGSVPSPVIAVSSNRVLQLLNNQYYLINREGGSFNGTANELTHTASSVYLTDPQVMWDPYTSRFYYSYEETLRYSVSGINWGFSKTADPTSAADFCSYFSEFNYGEGVYPDKQSLGDNKNFLFFSSETVALPSGDDLGSSVDWISKPPVGSACPAQTSFRSGISSLTNAPASGSEMAAQPTKYPYYPVVAKQVDPNPSTWIVGLPTVAKANYINLIRIYTGSNGLPVVGTPTNVNVPAYSLAPTVPQGGKSYNGGAAPALLTFLSFNGMYMSYDPRLAHYSLWTTDTIAGGINEGTAVRWYEIFPGGNSLDQSGTIASTRLNFFNSAIAPDRAYIPGEGAKYGSDMAITFSSSSANTYPRVWYVAKYGAQPSTAPISIKRSTGPDTDSSCALKNEPSTCWFGDWPGAAPDPLAVTSNSTSGKVWLTNEWNVLPPNNTGEANWRTVIAEIGFN